MFLFQVASVFVQFLAEFDLALLPGVFVDTLADLIQDVIYLYESFNSFIDVGEDCSDIHIDNVSEEIARKICKPDNGNEILHTVAEYWITNYSQLESIR